VKVTSTPVDAFPDFAFETSTSIAVGVGVAVGVDVPTAPAVFWAGVPAGVVDGAGVLPQALSESAAAVARMNVARFNGSPYLSDELPS